MSPPLSKEAAPLDAETLGTLKAEIAKRGMNADKLRKRLVPPPSGATFHRAIRGLKVSKPVQDACAAMARTIRETGTSRRVMIDSVPTEEECAQYAGFAAPVRVGLEQGHVQPLHTKAFTLTDAEPAAYDFDPDPEAA